MIYRFLNAKHWQLFILTFGIPMIIQSIMMGSIFANFASRTEPDIDFMFKYMKFFQILILLFMSVLLGWYWSVAIGLQRFIPDELKLKVILFKIFLIIPILYLTFFVWFFMTSFTSGDPNLSIFAFIVPFHVFSMFCIFYCLYFVAKTLKTAELQQRVTFGDFVGEFFLIWFFPIGIWIIQPKINEMIEKE